MIFRYRRYFGVVVTHYTAMVYSARYAEMVEVLGQTLFYLNPNAPVQLDSPLSDLPRQVKVLIWWLIPSKCALDLIQHSLFSYEWPPLLNIHVLWPYSVRICHSFVFISVILFHVCRGFSQTICPPFASSICFARLMRSSFSAPGGPISPSLQSTVSILMCKCWSPLGVIHVEEPVLELVLVVVTVSPPANDHLVAQSL